MKTAAALLSFCFTPPIHTFTTAGVSNAAKLGVFAAVAAVVSLMTAHAARRARQAAQAAAKADRMRTALLAAVGHDLRTPLAAAKAAISGLRSRDIQLTPADQGELLATADESLDLLTHLADSLLDVSRLQTGALPVFPRPANLQMIIARALDSLGPRAQAVWIDMPPALPPVLADPAITERVIANVTANALRYSPGGSPPRLTARACVDRIELRVVDCGPGVPSADRDRMFAPFQRLGDTDATTGVELGLAASRGLTEAMRGTLEAEQTPGGGLTMVISLPAAPRLARVYPGKPGRPEGEETEPARRGIEHSMSLTHTAGLKAPETRHGIRFGRGSDKQASPQPRRTP
jgi:two-component system, OmpR family, sensor histidine kinase KdpD